MIKISLKAAGIEGMMEALAGAPSVKFAKATARAAFTKFARETRDQLRSRTPVNTGNLKKATQAKGTQGGGAKVYVARDGSSTGKGFHSHIVEKGTKQRRTKKGANRGRSAAQNYQAPVLAAARARFDGEITKRLRDELIRKLKSDVRRAKKS